MKRREVMAGLAAASVAWPLVPHAQQAGKTFASVWWSRSQPS